MGNLAGRLRQTDGREILIRLSRQKLDRFFFAFSDMLDDGRFDDIYDRIAPPDEEDILLCQFLSQLPQTPERSDLLYQILVEPFAAMKGEGHG